MINFSQDKELEENIKRLKLRGVIAFAARCSRRVFPLVWQYYDNPDKANLDKLVTLAEKFAGGERINLPEASALVAQINKKEVPFPVGGGYPRTPDKNIDYAFRSALYAGEAAKSAISYVSSIPPTINCAKEPLDSAIEAVKQAALVTEPFLEDRFIDQDDPLYSKYQKFRNNKNHVEEVIWAREAVNRDFQKLLQSHEGKWEKLGLVINTSENGPLGSLWDKDKVPGWYQEAQKAGQQQLRSNITIDVKNFNEHLLSDLQKAKKEDKVPNAICWTLNTSKESSSIKVQQVIKNIKKIQQISAKYHRASPSLVVFAPNLDEPNRLQLVFNGAIVFTNSQKERDLPYDADSLRANLEASYMNWKQDSERFWYYQSAESTERLSRDSFTEKSKSSSHFKIFCVQLLKKTQL